MDTRLQDPAWLRQRFADPMVTYQDVADELGCSTTTVYKACRKYGIANSFERRARMRRRRKYGPKIDDAPKAA